MSAPQDEIRRNGGRAFPQSWRSQTGERRDLANIDDAAHEVSLIAGDLCGVSVSTMTMRPR